MENDQNIFYELILGKNFSMYQTDPSAFERILQKNLPSIRKNHPEIYLKVIEFYHWILEYAAFRNNLINKNITVLAGKESSGKTSFFNTVFGEQILPPGLSGNIPVYCACKNHRHMKMLTKGERLVSVEKDAFFKLFSETDNKENAVSEKLFDSIMTFSEHTGLRHITFLDLGGYKKTSDREFNDDMSPDRMIRRINRCSSLIWFADIDPNSLSISDDDIEILKMTDPDIPKLIIISKADIYPQAAFNEIFEKTKKIIFARKIKNIDILAYSSKQPEKFDKYKILAYLDRWDHQTEPVNFTEIFSSLFAYSPDETACEKNLSDILPELEAFSDRLFQVQNAFKPDSENNGFVPVDSVQNDSVARTKATQKAPDFSKNKHGSLPAANPEKLFRNYNCSNAKDMTLYEQYTDSVVTIIMENLNSLKPAMSENKNGSEYKKELMGILSQYFHVIPDKRESDSSKNDTNLSDNEQDNAEKQSGRRSRRSRTENEQSKSGSLFKRDKNK